MRAHEFIIETTTSGAIATVATPIGGMLSRAPALAAPYKYKKTSRKSKQNAHRRFENSIGQ